MSKKRSVDNAFDSPIEPVEIYAYCFTVKDKGDFVFHLTRRMYETIINTLLEMGRVYIDDVYLNSESVLFASMYDMEPVEGDVKVSEFKV